MRTKMLVMVKRKPVLTPEEHQKRCWMVSCETPEKDLAPQWK